MSTPGGLSAERIDLFEKVPVPKAVLKLAIPTIIGQLVAMIYNLADTYFVGQINNPNQVAAVSICFPAVMTMMAMTNFFGIGGGSMFSRCLGSREYGKARNVSAFCFYTVIGVGFVYVLAVLFAMNPLLRLLGASDATIGFCRDYMLWVVVVGGLPFMANIFLGNLVRAEGASKQASIGVSIGGLLNLILDPIFILPFGLNLQVKGAAIATMLSNCVGVIYFIVYLRRNRKKTIISLSPGDYRAKDGIATGVMQIGLPALIQSMMPVVSNTLLNNFAGAYSDRAIAAIGIVRKIDIFAMNVTMGMSQGVLPLLAYNYSSGGYERLRKARAFALICSISFCLLCVGVYESIPGLLVKAFIKDAKTVAYGTVFLRIQCLSTPFMAFNFMTVSTFQAAGQTKPSMIMTFARKGLPDIPMFFLMDWLFPLIGLMWVQPIVDGLASVIAFTLFRNFTRKMKKKQSEQQSLVLERALEQLNMSVA